MYVGLLLPLQCYREYSTYSLSELSIVTATKSSWTVV